MTINTILHHVAILLEVIVDQPQQFLVEIGSFLHRSLLAFDNSSTFCMGWELPETGVKNESGS